MGFYSSTKYVRCFCREDSNARAIARATVTVGHTPLAPFFIRGYGSKSIMFEGQCVRLGPLFPTGREGVLLKH